MNTTLITLNVPNKIKDDFYTVCKVNQSSMTSEIVRFMNHFISEEVEKFKQYYFCKDLFYRCRQV